MAMYKQHSQFNIFINLNLKHYMIDFFSFIWSRIMPILIKTHDQAMLCEELRQFFNSTEHPEYANIQAISQRIKEIQACFLDISKEEATQNKLQKLQQLRSEIQAQHQQVNQIYQNIAARWMTQTMNAGVPLKTAQSVVQTVFKT